MKDLQKVNNGLTNLKKSGKQRVIEAFEQPKIYSLESLEPLQMALKYIFVMVGLREMPQKEERAVLIDYIQENYSLYSVEEIKLAFKLGLKREFECEMNHFEMFSCNYFGQVFDAYLKYRERIAKEHMIKQQREKDLKEQNREITDQEKQKLKKEFFDTVIKPMFKGYKKHGKINFGYTPVRIVYESLKNDHKLIDLTDKEMEKIKKECRESVGEKQKVCKLTGEKKNKKEIFFELCQTEAIKISFDKIEEL